VRDASLTFSGDSTGFSGSGLKSYNRGFFGGCPGGKKSGGNRLDLSLMNCWMPLLGGTIDEKLLPSMETEVSRTSNGTSVCKQHD